MSRQSPAPLSTEQKQQFMEIITKQVNEVLDRAYYYTYNLTNKWVELGISQISKRDYQRLTDFMKERVQYLKSPKAQPTIDFIKQYHAHGLMHLNLIKKRTEQIVKKAALARTSASTYRNAQALEANMNRVLDSLEKTNNDFILIETTFLTPRNDLENSQRSIQSRQNLDISHNSSNGSQNNSTKYETEIRTITSVNNKVQPERTVIKNEVSQNSYTNTHQRPSSKNQPVHSSNPPNTTGLSLTQSNSTTLNQFTTANQYNRKIQTQPMTYQGTITANRLLAQNHQEVKRTQTQLSNGFKKDEPTYTMKREEKQVKPQVQAQKIQRKIREQYEGLLREKDVHLMEKQKKIESQRKQMQLREQQLKNYQERLRQMQQLMARQKSKNQQQKRSQLFNSQKLQQQNTQLKHELNQLRLTKQSQTRQLKPLQDKLFSTKQQLARLQDQLPKLKRSIDQAKKQFSQQKQLIEHKSHEVKAKTEQFERQNGEVMKLSRWIEGEVGRRLGEVVEGLEGICKGGNPINHMVSKQKLQPSQSLQQQLLQNLTTLQTKVTSIKTQYTQSISKITSKSQQLTKLQQKLSQTTKNLTSLQHQLSKKQLESKQLKLNDGTVLRYEDLVKESKKLEKDIQDKNQQMKRLRNQFLDKKVEYDSKLDEKEKKFNALAQNMQKEYAIKIENRQRQINANMSRIEQDYDKKIQMKKHELKTQEERVKQVKDQFNQMIKDSMTQTVHSQVSAQRQVMNQYMQKLRQMIANRPQFTSRQSPISHQQNQTQIAHLKQQLHELHQQRSRWANYEYQVQQYHGQLNQMHGVLKQFQAKCAYYERLLREKDDEIHQKNLHMQQAMAMIQQMSIQKAVKDQEPHETASMSTDMSLEKSAVVFKSENQSVRSQEHSFHTIDNEGFRKPQSVQVAQIINNQPSTYVSDLKINNQYQPIMPVSQISPNIPQGFYPVHSTLPVTLPPASETFSDHSEIQQLFNQRQQLQKNQNQLTQQLQKIESYLNVIKPPVQSGRNHLYVSSSHSTSSRSAQLQFQHQGKSAVFRTNEERLKQINERLASFEKPISSHEEERFDAT